MIQERFQYGSMHERCKCHPKPFFILCLSITNDFPVSVGFEDNTEHRIPLKLYAFLVKV